VSKSSHRREEGIDTRFADVERPDTRFAVRQSRVPPGFHPPPGCSTKSIPGGADEHPPHCQEVVPTALLKKFKKSKKDRKKISEFFLCQQ
jgi:hypothetical protein